MRALAILSLLLFAFGSQAATTASNSVSSLAESPTGNKDISINPIVGLAIFSLTDTPSSFTNTSGMTGGALVDIASSNSLLKWETGALFTQEGATVGDGVVTNNYMVIPVMAKYTPIDAATGSFHLRGGFAPSILMSSSTVANGTSADTKSSFNNFDIQMMLGVGGVIPLGPKAGLTADLTYVRGLTKVNTEGDIAAHNQGVILSGGLIF